MPISCVWESKAKKKDYSILLLCLHLSEFALDPVQNFLIFRLEFCLLFNLKMFQPISEFLILPLKSAEYATLNPVICPGDIQSGFSCMECFPCLLIEDPDIGASQVSRMTHDLFDQVKRQSRDCMSPEIFPTRMDYAIILTVDPVSFCHYASTDLLPYIPSSHENNINGTIARGLLPEFYVLQAVRRHHNFPAPYRQMSI